MSILSQYLQPGSTLQVYFNPGNVNNGRIHIRAVVDGDYIIYRRWSKDNHRWYYLIEHRYYFEMLYNSGNLSKINRLGQEELPSVEERN